MASERVTGTLKFFGPTKDGDKATLTGKWDNGKEKMWCTWKESKVLRDAKLVYEHPVETWDDGKPKWMVHGQPEITLDVTWKDKVATTKVMIGEAPTANREVMESEAKVGDMEALIQLSMQYGTAFSMAALEQVKTLRRPSWEIDTAALQAGAATCFIAMRDAAVQVQHGQAKAVREKLHQIEDEMTAKPAGS